MCRISAFVTAGYQEILHGLYVLTLNLATWHKCEIVTCVHELYLEGFTCAAVVYFNNCI